ncbi:MAG: hypothetical protein D6765_00640 [Bacteroidetes bacterium]|nr:MAG: hypothetical protein D6765_00640 [Bacteroidota bacterium]
MRYASIQWLGKLVLLVTVFGWGCNTTQFLRDDEAFLSKNKIVFDKKQSGKLKNKTKLADELSRLYQQKPNSRWLWIPRQYFFYVSDDTLGKSSFGKSVSRFARKKLGEEPALFSDSLARLTAQNMQYYLQNKGFFQAQVKFFPEFKARNRKVEVTYHVAPGWQYLIDTVIFVSRDTQLEALLRQISPRTNLKPGQPVSRDLYDAEVNRITRYLRNHGYAYFYPQYIKNLQALDSSQARVKLLLEVVPPPGRSSHRVYRIGDIYVYPGYSGFLEDRPRKDTLVDGVHFLLPDDEFRIKPHTLLNSIALKPGALFSQEAMDNTIRQLNSLQVFRIVNVKYETDSLQADVLNFRIYLTPNKKWEFGLDFDISNTNRKGPVAGNLIGLTFTPSLQSRNMFRGAELFVSSLDFGVELALFDQDTISTSILNTLDFKFQTDLYYPRFVDHLGLNRGLHRLGLLSDRYNHRLRERANSNFSLSYNLLSVLNYYRYNLVNLSFGYDLLLNPNNRFIVNHFGVDFLAPTTFQAFRDILDDNPFLQNSFTRQLITGFLFRDLTYIHASPANRRGASWYLQASADLSGLEIWALNRLFNALTDRSEAWKLFDVRFSQYLRLELDLRRYWTLTARKSFVARFNTGAALPFGFTDNVPYVKQFFAGGPIGIRGWWARELGPGRYVDPITQDRRNRNLFYQTGDFKLEFNFEYRFPLIRPFNLFDTHGALFLDAGNVWSLGFSPDEEINRPGSLLSWKRTYDENGEILNDNLFLEMGLSAGFGLRMDFTYVIIRLDVATPVKNNFPDPARNNSYWVDWEKWSPQRLRWNLGLGYPF